MRHRRLLVPALGLLLTMVAGPAAAAPGPRAASDPMPTADHISGSFTACGRISAFTAPVPGTPGSLTIEGLDAFGPHSFPIDEAATVDPLLAGLAAAGDWTCLDLIGDGGAVLTSLAVPSSSIQCGQMGPAGGGGLLGQRAGSTHPLTTIVLDGDAATVIAADADLSDLLSALAAALGNPISETAEACLNLGFAADGTLASMTLDYDQFGGSNNVAVIACGPVDGTALQYRDPASQPYPEAGTVSVDGFQLDATLLDPVYQEVLSFHLDAGINLCLQIRVVDTAIVEAAVITGIEGPTCGKLDVVGGLAFVNGVVVEQGLTAMTSAEPAPSSIASACFAVQAQEGAVATSLDICGDLQDVSPDSVTISGVTFHFEAAVSGVHAPPHGGPQAIRIVGPYPLEGIPFGPANFAEVTHGSVPGCSGEMPGTDLASPPNPWPVKDWVALLGVLFSTLLGGTLRSRRASSPR